MPPKLSTPPFCYRTIHAPTTKLPKNSQCRHQSHCASELEQVFNNGSPRLLQSANDHCVFLSTRVHDHIQQVFHIRPDGISELSQTDRASDGIPEMSQTDCAHTCSNFSLLYRLRRFHLESPSTCVPTRRSTQSGQMFHVCHRGLQTFVSTRAIRSSVDQTCPQQQHLSVFPRLVPPFARILATAARGDLTCHQIFSSCLHIALRCRSLAIIEALRIAESTPRFLSCPALPQQAHTLTPRHQFTLAWADCTSPPSFASTDPHLHATLARFCGARRPKCCFQRIVPWPSPEQQYVSVSHERRLPTTSSSLASSASAISAICSSDCQRMSTGN